MKKHIFCVLISGYAAALSATAAPSAPVLSEPATRPQAAERTVITGTPGFSLRDGIRVHYKVSRSEEGRAAIRALMSAGFQILPEESKDELEVKYIPHPDSAYYIVSVSPERVSLQIASEGALPAAAQALARSISQDSEGAAALPTMRISAR